MKRRAVQPVSAGRRGWGLSPERAACVLGTIRLTIGTTALFAPQAMVKRFGADPDENPAALYVLRLFGVRTVVLGAELLLRGRGERRADLLRIGVGIHAADAAAAVTAGIRRELPTRAAVAGALISSLNTALAIRSLRART